MSGRRKFPFDPYPPPRNEVIARLERQRDEHADDPETGVCRICGVSECRVWTLAVAMLSSPGMSR